MKEPKFRVWDGEKLHYNICRLHFNSAGELYAVMLWDETLLINPKPIIEEITGLKDKHGKDEYHKDIVSVDKVIGSVEWDDKVGAWYYQWQDGKKTYPRNYYDIIDEVVIGNVHNNPELLKMPELPKPQDKHIGSAGGKARAAALTPERRKEIAIKAAQTRWRKVKCEN